MAPDSGYNSEARLVRPASAAAASAHDEEVEPLVAINITNLIRHMTPYVTPECCIYRVDQLLRSVSTKSYTPRVVSIGPFHHGREEYAAMEDVKVKLLLQFIQKTKRSLDEIIRAVKSWEERVRLCYSERVEPDSAKFVQMILMDGVFICEYMLFNCCGYDEADGTDYVIFRPRLVIDVDHDLTLLENQLPFFVIQGLYSFIKVAMPDTYPTLHVLAHDYSLLVANTDRGDSELTDIKHLLDLVRSLHLPKAPRKKPKKGRRIKFISKCATRLQEAGVKFKVSESKCLSNINFNKHEGVLEIPVLKFYNTGNSLFRNLMAYEQCCYPYNTYICDYVDFLDNLINTSRDVDLLEKHGVLKNYLDDSETLSTTINNLCTHMSCDSYYAALCDELDEYCSISRHEWMATCRRDYFSTPWRIASTIAAFILLFLTLIQTICSIISLI